MESKTVHLKNKYPNGHVVETDGSIDAYDRKGVHRVALRKNGAGQWLCSGGSKGCPDSFCLEPIPRAARVHKLDSKGNRCLDHRAESRKADREQFVEGDRVLSITELEAKGWRFDAKGGVVSKPTKESTAPVEAPTPDASNLPAAND